MKANKGKDKAAIKAKTVDSPKRWIRVLRPGGGVVAGAGVREETTINNERRLLFQQREETTISSTHYHIFFSFATGISSVEKAMYCLTETDLSPTCNA